MARLTSFFHLSGVHDGWRYSCATDDSFTLVPVVDVLARDALGWLDRQDAITRNCLTPPLKVARSDMKLLRDKNAELRGKLEVARNDADAAGNAAAVLEAENDRLKSEVKELQAKNEELKAERTCTLKGKSREVLDMRCSECGGIVEYITEVMYCRHCGRRIVMGEEA